MIGLGLAYNEIVCVCTLANDTSRRTTRKRESGRRLDLESDEESQNVLCVDATSIVLTGQTKMV